MTAACGNGYNSHPTNVGLFGNWNVAMYPAGSNTAGLCFRPRHLAEGANNYSGGSTTYNGSVSHPHQHVH